MAQSTEAELKGKIIIRKQQVLGIFKAKFTACVFYVAIFSHGNMTFALSWREIHTFENQENGTNFKSHTHQHTVYTPTHTGSNTDFANIFLYSKDSRGYKEVQGNTMGEFVQQ